MANGDIWSQAGVGSGGETGADPGNEAQAALANAMGGQQPAAAPAQAPAAAPAAGAGPGGGYDPLAGLSQIMGALGQLPGPQQQPAGAQITQRHGGLLTGLAGVLIDGLASGMAPNAQMAYQIPMQRQQQQAQMAELQLRQQQAQQELAMQPIKAKAEMAQAAINILQAGHMMRDLSKEHQLDMLGAQAKYTQEAIDQGRARLDATAPTLDAAQKRTQQLQAQSKDKALNFGYQVTKWDDAGNPTEYGIYESYPQGSLQKAFHYEFQGDDTLGIKPEVVDLPAGMLESEARLRLSAVANEHSAAMKLASDRMLAQKMQVQLEKEGFQESERLKADERANRMLALSVQRTQQAGQHPAEGAIKPMLNDFIKADRSVGTLRDMIKAGADGNQVANSLAQLSATLMTVSAGGVHRINTTELDMTGPGAGSLVRRIEMHLDKGVSGKLPADYVKDLNQLAGMFERRQIQNYMQGVDMVNRQYSQTIPGYTPMPYGLTSEQEKIGRGGSGTSGGGHQVGDIVIIGGQQKTITKTYPNGRFDVQ